MAGSVNKVILLGNLGRDPEVRTTQNGGKIVQLSIATSESWKDRGSGERREKTEWHRVVIFNDRLTDIAERYLRKGSKVYVEGQLQTREWADKDGVKKYTTEVVLQQFRGELALLDGRGGGDEMGGGGGPDYGESPSMGGYAAPAAARPASGSGYGGGGSSRPGPDLDDEIPF